MQIFCPLLVHCPAERENGAVVHSAGQGEQRRRHSRPGGGGLAGGSDAAVARGNDSAPGVARGVRGSVPPRPRRLDAIAPMRPTQRHGLHAADHGASVSSTARPSTPRVLRGTEHVGPRSATAWKGRLQAVEGPEELVRRPGQAWTRRPGEVDSVVFLPTRASLRGVHGPRRDSSGRVFASWLQEAGCYHPCVRRDRPASRV